MALEKEQLRGLLRTMLAIRAFEMKVAELFAAGKIPGSVHSYVGEEAVAAGVCACLRQDDYITSTHRGHGHLIAKGGDMKRMMAELFGRKTGYCKGKGGSMHIADLDLGILGANGIVGGGINIAVGAALSAQYRGTGQVAVCFFGDGASNQSTFHEGINLASIWDLPALFVCENNMYGVSMSQKQAMKVSDIADRARAYAIPGVAVDGNDAVAVCEAAREALQRARAGQGPTLLECKTYRMRGHFEGDRAAYRDPGEVEAWARKDPILRLRERLAETGMLSPARALELERQVQELLEEAVKFAEESPFPPPEDTLEDVFCP
jgi:acetoin:2,6-dichlorophenolindophenol oxidoreductase subunit alpha